MNRLFVFLTLIILTSCASNETASEEKLYVNFVMRYIQDNGNFNAKAKFKTVTKGEKEAAFFPSTGVSFMDMPMYKKDIPGVGQFYEYDGSKHPKASILYRFLDQNDKSAQLEATYSPMRNLTIQESVIELDSGFTLVWEGEPLIQGDELLLNVEIEGEDLQKLIYTGATKSNRLFYRKEQLEKLSRGKATFSYMKLHYERYPEDSKIGGSYTLEYHFKPIEIEIK